MSPKEGRLAQVRRFVAACPDAPVYGSQEWLQLAPMSPEWIASVIRAAECWQSDYEAAMERLEVERQSLLFEAACAKHAEDVAYVERRDAHRAEWGNKSWRPHPANRVRPAGEVA